MPTNFYRIYVSVGFDTKEEFTQLEEEVIRLSNVIYKMDTINDMDSVKFGNLGLRSKIERIAWLSINFPGGKGGYEVDFSL